MVSLVLAVLTAFGVVVATAVQSDVIAHRAFASREQKLRRFDGIGGISGGGATSRLLVEYDAQVQAEILDFLFKPNFGASLQTFKVEIGADSQSTDGSESSHMHSRSDLNLNRGYEWWLLKEAKKRNPDLVLYGLPWAFPGWVSDDPSKPFKNPDLTANYTLQWLLGARDVHGLKIDLIGVWNERQPSAAYVKNLRKLLDHYGFEDTLIVNNDGNDELALCTRLENDRDYLDAVGVIGFHYPNDRNTKAFEKCNSLGKPVWSSEESSSYDDANGAACWARVIASHYVLNNITGNMMWNLVGSYYHGTNWYASSMLTAVEPWTGHVDYDDGMPVVWATAHWTQFTEPGWGLLPVGQGSGELRHGGYYVTLVSPCRRYFTTVIVKISRDHAPCTRPRLWEWETAEEEFKLEVDLDLVDKESIVQTWYSNFEAAAGPVFQKIASQTFSKSNKETSSFLIQLNVTAGSVYTVSNRPDSGFKAKPQIVRESNASFPLPYRDDFTAYACDNCYAAYLTDQMGAFEIIEVRGGTKALVQRSPQKPIVWNDSHFGPMTVIGMVEWEDVRVATRFRFPAGQGSEFACLSTRADQHWYTGVTLCVNASKWFMTYGGAKLANPEQRALTEGAHDLDREAWHDLELITVGQTASAAVGGQPLTKIKIRKTDNGFVALGSSSYTALEFSKLEITPVGPNWYFGANNKEILRAAPVDPVDDDNWDLKLRRCTPNGHTSEAERFELTPNWQIKHVSSDKCVSADENGHLSLQRCQHDHPPQQFRNDYTMIRNEKKALTHATLGALCGDLATSRVGFGAAICSTSTSFQTWVYFPNTFQLRKSLHFDSSEPTCLHASRSSLLSST